MTGEGMPGKNECGSFARAGNKATLDESRLAADEGFSQKVFGGSTRTTKSV